MLPAVMCADLRLHFPKNNPFPNPAPSVIGVLDVVLQIKLIWKNPSVNQLSILVYDFHVRSFRTIVDE